MNIHIITIGDEILIGQIVDTNSAWMAQQLNLAGATIGKIVTVTDEKEDIITALEQSIQEADIILTTGGLGPTKDDLTKQALAEFLGVDLEFNQESYDHITAFFKSINRSVLEPHEGQAHMPKGVLLLDNKVGTAHGMWHEKNGKVLISMPGVPYEMKHIMTEQVIPILKEKYRMKAVAHRTILTAGQGETFLAEAIKDIEENLPDNISLAFLPNLGVVRLRLTGIADSFSAREKLEEALDRYASDIEQRLGNWVFGRGGITQEEALGQLLIEKGKRLVTAESCTGGRISSRIVNIAGSSRYFDGGFVVYSNDMKMKQLGVGEGTLRLFGAVSEETVKEMVVGALKQSGADIAVAVSGIAGPGGGTTTKPVGTIWLAVGDGNQTKTLLLSGRKDREKNIEYTTKRALNLVREFLLETEA